MSYRTACWGRWRAVFSDTEALKRRGLDVTVVEMLPQVLPPLDADMAAFVSHHLEEEGIHIVLGDGIKAFVGGPAVTGVVLQSGKEIPADLVILSIGVRPELKLAQEAGLTIGQAGGIAVNDRLQTSDPDIYAAGFRFYVSVTHSLDHAGDYPGGAMMHMKLIVEKDSGRLLGGQIVGEHGVDKRIDVLATALYARLKVSDLENLDLAYAPQFSSAKDPVIMAGFTAANIGRSELGTITCEALQTRLKNKEHIQLVDVRMPAEYKAGHLEGAHLIPVDELRDRLQELDPKEETVVYCRIGFRGYLAARILQQSGFERVLNLTGGILICQENAVVKA